MEKLSFDFENDFKYSHVNEFDSEADYLFESGIFLFWVATDNGIVSGVSGTRKEELKSWANDDETSRFNISDEAFAIHENDEIILNKYYLKKIQELIDKVK